MVGGPRGDALPRGVAARRAGAADLRNRRSGSYNAGVLPDFDRLMLESDNPSLKSLLVDLDEQGRAKGSRMAEPAELLQETNQGFSTKGGN